jgi:AcrR family transcriptional regulator
LSNQNYHHKDLKEALIKNGLKLFDEEGYDKFSMRKVAKACGVSQTAPYRHFENKDSLIIAIISQAYHKFDQVLKEAIQRYPDDASSQLREMAYLYVKFFVENPEYLKFFFFSDVNKSIKMAKGNYSLFENMEQPYKTFINAVESYKAGNDTNGINKQADTNALVLACWGLAHGIAILITRDDFQYSGDCMELVRKIIWSDLFIK